MTPATKAAHRAGILVAASILERLAGEADPISGGARRLCLLDAAQQVRAEARKPAHGDVPPLLAAMGRAE